MDRSTLADRVRDILKGRILDGNLAPGEALSIDALTEELNVSRTPVRTALQLLAAEELVTIRDRRGYSVTKLKAEEISDVLDIRLMIETYAAEHGMVKVDEDWLGRMDGLLGKMGEALQGDAGMDIRQFEVFNAEFHRGIVDLLRNRRLGEIYSSLNALGWAFRVNYMSASERVLEGQGEHGAILKTFAARDVERAKGAIATHVANTKDDLVQQIVG